jgi:hypothetical protein
LELLGLSQILDFEKSVELSSPVRATDASAWLAEDGVSHMRIRVGDAGIALDPLSSSGVQKAIQSALAGAVTANTILRKPDSAPVAVAFYQSNLEQTSRQHAIWAADRYRAAATRLHSKFWQERATRFDFETSTPERLDAPAGSIAMDSQVVLSNRIELIELPCIQGEFVVSKRALKHPNLATPVAYVGGHEIVPLLNRIRGRCTVRDVAFSWSDQLPLQSTIEIARWLVQNGMLVSEASASHEFAG